MFSNSAARSVQRVLGRRSQLCRSLQTGRLLSSASARTVSSSRSPAAIQGIARATTSRPQPRASFANAASPAAAGASSSGAPSVSRIPPMRPVAELQDKLQFLKVIQSSNGVMFLEPSNPPVNALRSEMLDDFELLGAHLRQADCPTRVIVMRCDVAGANIKEMAKQTPAEAEAYSKRFKAALEGLRAANIPMIGFTNRYALGGGLELLMFCDIRYAGPRAILQAPEVDLDTLQSFGGCVVLPRLLSPSVAYRAQMRGDPIPLDIAERDGLITEVIRDEDPNATEHRAFDDALVIAQKRPGTVRLNTEVVRYALNEGLGKPAEAHALESKNFGLTFEGGAEGMQAFLDRLRFQTWGHRNLGGTVENVDFKAMGIDTVQIKSLIAHLKKTEAANLQAAGSPADQVKAIFFNGAVSGGDVKKLYQALTTDEARFEEFLRLEYQWHELMRSKAQTPLFFFGSQILGGGGLGVFQSMKHRVCQPDTIFLMPEIALGACPDVAGTYDLPRLEGGYGRGMAIAGLELSGAEAKAVGLADYLVDASIMPQLKDAVFDTLLQGGEVQPVLERFQALTEVPPSLLRHNALEWNQVFNANKSLQDIVQEAVAEERPKENKPPKSLLQRVQANWHPEKASAFGVILSDVMHKEGLALSLTQARALEYAVWTAMPKVDFLESINSRFILPRKQRRAPVFSTPGIMELDSKQFGELEAQVQELVESSKLKMPEIEAKLFSQL